MITESANSLPLPPGILDKPIPLKFQPIPLLKRRLPFNDPDSVFEVKWDGFRALTVIELDGPHTIDLSQRASVRLFCRIGKTDFRWA